MISWAIIVLMSRVWWCYYYCWRLYYQLIFFYFSSDIIFNCRFSGNMVSFALKISFMRSLLLDLTSERQTTSYGLSSSKLLWVAWRRREITMLKVVMLVTGRTTSMNSLEGWIRFWHVSYKIDCGSWDICFI